MDPKVKVEKKRPITKHWWFWVFAAMVGVAFLKQLTGWTPSESLETLADGSPLHLVCKVAFPCGLVWDLRAAQKAALKPTKPEPSRIRD